MEALPLPLDRAPSGIPELDRIVGGFELGRTTVIIGAAGAGKTVTAMRFVGEGLRAGELVCCLTDASPDELAWATLLAGLDAPRILDAIRTGQLRIAPGFANGIRSPTSTWGALRWITGQSTGGWSRVVLDPVNPLIIAPSEAAEPALKRLLELLGGSSATALLTLRGGPQDLGNPQLAPLREAASALLWLELAPPGRRIQPLTGNGRIPGISLELAPALFSVPGSDSLQGAGAGGAEGAEGAGGAGGKGNGAGPRRKVALLNTTGNFPLELRALLEGRYAVSTLTEFPEVPAAAEALAHAPTLISFSRSEVPRVLELCRTLRIAGSRQPIVLFADFPSRSADRARALALGADDFLCTGVSPEELALRLEALFSRKPLKPTEYLRNLPHVAGIEQPRDLGGHPVVMPRTRFLEAVRKHVKEDENPLFSLVLFRTRSLASLVQQRFLELLTRQVRQAELDLVAEHSEGVAVYLHGLRARDARRLVARLLIRWVGSGGKEVPFVMIGYPEDAEALLEFIAQPPDGSGAA